MTNNLLELNFKSKHMFNTNYILNVMHFNVNLKLKLHVRTQIKDLDTLYNNEK